jgi:choline dehydrogenase-like flavoprotein
LSASEFDLIVIGSGFGGAMAALPAVEAGTRVLMIERGDWVARSAENWGSAGFFNLTRAYSLDDPYQVDADNGRGELGALTCVGGASVFYGGVALRLRKRDFDPDPEMDTDSGASWPYSYDDLEPYYSRVEQLLGVAGEAGADPTEPPRSQPYPHVPAALAPVSARMAAAAAGLNLKPFPLPLAINYNGGSGRPVCERCGTCDGFACAVSAKNDIATTIIPSLQARGMTLETNMMAVRLPVEGGRVTSVECLDTRTLEPKKFAGAAVVVAAGALATPHLLLASGLDRHNPAGAAIGRYLMRHCNAVLMGVFTRKPMPGGGFHKQIGIQDYYFGHPSISEPRGKLGCIQQFATPQTSYMVRHAETWILKRYTGFQRRLALSVAPWFVPMGVPFITGFIVIAEDRPHAANRVRLAAGTTRFGMPAAAIDHHYDARDTAARTALIGAARGILKKAGAIHTVRDDIQTFSHAVGTVRIGSDPATSPLDGWGAFRGVENLYVADGSVLPRSGGVNPSLTIAANALRTGERIAATL